MTETFRIGLSADFVRPDGRVTFPHFDLAPLRASSSVEVVILEHEDPLRADQLEALDALVLLGHHFGPTSVPRSGRLGVIARFGVGYDTVDVRACTEAGIALVIAPTSVRRPVAVAIITLMLALTSRLITKDKLTREAATGFARRADYMGVGLVGRTFGSLGVGNIGAEVFRLAKPFGMRFIAHDPYCDPAVLAELGVEAVEIEDLFRQADVLSVSCPLTAATRHMVNAERLALMKPTSFLINTARGSIVDQRALIAVLAAGRIAGAGLDVLEKEPPDIDDPILKLDNVILAPHALCFTDQWSAVAGSEATEAIQQFLAGGEPRGMVVNREVFSTSLWRQRLAALRSR
jgi:phosphoglycerate dehydrogenase-like enzyme